MKKMLRDLTTSGVLERIKGFNRDYVYHWKDWLRVSQSCDFQVAPTPDSVAIEFTQIMRKWHACRGKGGLRCPTEVQNTLDSATKQIRRVGSADLRCFEAPGEVLVDAICNLWRIFENGLCLTSATEVAVSKAILLVTKGRIGPAFDSNVKAAFNIRRIKDCGTYVKLLGEIAGELAAFEAREKTTLDDLAEQAGRPAAVGRAVDMVLGPREREKREISAR